MLSSEHGTRKTVNAKLWSCLQDEFANPFKVLPPRSEAMPRRWRGFHASWSSGVRNEGVEIKKDSLCFSRALPSEQKLRVERLKAKVEPLLAQVTVDYHGDMMLMMAPPMAMPPTAPSDPSHPCACSDF